MQSSEVDDLAARMESAASTAILLAEQLRGNPELLESLRPVALLLKRVSTTPTEDALIALEHSLERAFRSLVIKHTSGVH